MKKNRPQLDIRHVVARPNTIYSNEDARVIAPVLAEIEARDGVIKPMAILNEARDKASPLHPYFEWDDSKAAEQHRKQVAMTMARAICYRVKLAGSEALNYQPMLVRLKDQASDGKIQRGYVSVVRALTEPNLRYQMIENARREVDSFIKRYETVEALTGAMPIAHRLKDAIHAASAEALGASSTGTTGAGPDGPRADAPRTDAPRGDAPRGTGPAAGVPRGPI